LRGPWAGTGGVNAQRERWPIWPTHGEQLPYSRQPPCIVLTGCHAAHLCAPLETVNTNDAFHAGRLCAPVRLYM